MLEVGFFTLRWYGLLIAISFLIGLNLSNKLAYMRGLNKQLINELMPILVLSSIFGARLYYVLFEWRNYTGENFWSRANIFGIGFPIPSALEIWGGGIAIHGALIAGSFAVLAGSASVSPILSIPAIILSLILFLWTPPHFWALAIRYKDDYSNAEVPMLPVVEGTKVTGYRMVLYAFQVWAASLIFVPVADMGVVYLITAIAMGAMFTLFSFQVMINPTKKSAMRLFGFSISYITILFSLMAVDQLVRSGF